MGNLEATPRLSKDDNLLLRALHDGMASRSEDGETIDKRTFLQFFDFPGMFGERLFALFDQTHSGRINKEEFLKGMAIYLNGSTDQKIRLLFKLYDLQGHNSISVSELQTMLYSLARTPSLIPGYVDEERKYECKKSASRNRPDKEFSFSCKNINMSSYCSTSPSNRGKFTPSLTTHHGVDHHTTTTMPLSTVTQMTTQTMSPPSAVLPQMSTAAAANVPNNILMSISNNATTTTTTPLQTSPLPAPLTIAPPIPPSSAASSSSASPIKMDSPSSAPMLPPSTPNPKLSVSTPPLDASKKKFSLRASLTNAANAVLFSRKSPPLNPQKTPEMKPLQHQLSGGTPVQVPQTSPQMISNCAPIVPTTPFEEEHLHLMHIVNELVEKTFHEHNVHRDGLLSYEEFEHWVKQCPAMLEMMDFKFNRHAWKSGVRGGRNENGRPFHQGPLCVPKKPFGWRYHMFVLRDPFLYKFEVSDKDLERPVDIVFLDGMTIEGDEENEIITSHRHHRDQKEDEHENHSLLRLPFMHREDRHAKDREREEDLESRSHLRLPSFLHHEKGDRDRTDSKMSLAVPEEEPLMEGKDHYTNEPLSTKRADTVEPIVSLSRRDKKPSIKDAPSDLLRMEMHRHNSEEGKLGKASSRTTSFSFGHQDSEGRRYTFNNPSHFHELCEGHAGYYGFRMVTSHIDKETHLPVRKETMLYALSQMSRATWVRLLRKAAHNVSITKYYSIGKRIGKGKFGTVYQGTHFKTGEIVAIKAMDKSRVTQKDHEGLRAEIAILKLLVHPCVVRMRQVFESERYIYIVMDLHAAGDLGHKLLAVNQFPQSICRSVCHKLLETLQYLHQRGIVHRDIKPENIMLKDPNDFTQIVLIDFGLSKFAIPNEKMAETIGTIDYLAPEIFSKNYGFAVDQWALGVLLYAMLSGLLPFWGETLQAQRKSIETQDPDFTAVEWKGISKDAIDLIKGLLQKDPKKRLSIDEALKHRWFMEPVPQQPKSVVMHLSNVGEPPSFSALPPPAATSPKEEDSNPKMARSASSQRMANENGEPFILAPSATQQVTGSQILAPKTENGEHTRASSVILSSPIKTVQPGAEVADGVSSVGPTHISSLSSYPLP